MRQNGTIIEYQEHFEELKSQVMLTLPHLPKAYYKSVFTSGLKEEIKPIVKIIKPTTLANAFRVAILQENTITNLNREAKTYKPYPQSK